MYDPDSNVTIERKEETKEKKKQNKRQMIRILLCYHVAFNLKQHEVAKSRKKRLTYNIVKD